MAALVGIDNRSTAAHRDSTSLLQNIPETLDTICNSAELQSMWQRYRKEYTYAADIEYSGIMRVLEKLMEQGLALMTDCS